MMVGKSVILIDVGDFDSIVEETYGRVYNFQQQDGCKPRGTYKFSLPIEHYYDYENDNVPEVVNHEDMGVSFKSWLKRDPDKLLPCEKRPSYKSRLWWERNFYPSVEMILKDLHEKDILKDGNYIINIDW